jgi:pyridoxal phosphate enzyme (YggS family)
VTSAGVTIAERWAAVRARVEAACARVGRAPDEVTIIAVSKMQPASAVREALAAGAQHFGENYAQELATKRTDCGDGARWHFIGRLQSNKAKLVAGQVELVHAIDHVDTARALGKRLAAPAVQPILLAVNLGGEDTKGGVAEAAAPALARELAVVPGVRLDGLMTLPPPADDPEAMRPLFLRLRALRDRIASELGRPLPVLSMGMSDDFEVAVECGATHVRVGTAIFGPRAAPAG